jgi:hypothetical protein
MIVEREGDVPLVPIKGEVLAKLEKHLGFPLAGKDCKPLSCNSSLPLLTVVGPVPGPPHLLLLKLLELVSQFHVLDDPILQPYQIGGHPIIP